MFFSLSFRDALISPTAQIGKIQSFHFQIKSEKDQLAAEFAVMAPIYPPWSVSHEPPLSFANRVVDAEPRRIKQESGVFVALLQVYVAGMVRIL